MVGGIIGDCRIRQEAAVFDGWTSALGLESLGLSLKSICPSSASVSPAVLETVAPPPYKVLQSNPESQLI